MGSSRLKYLLNNVSYPELSSYPGRHSPAIVAFLYRYEVLHEGVTRKCSVSTDIILQQQVIQKLVLSLGETKFATSDLNCRGADIGFSSKELAIFISAAYLIDTLTKKKTLDPGAFVRSHYSKVVVSKIFPIKFSSLLFLKALA